MVTSMGVSSTLTSVLAGLKPGSTTLAIHGYTSSKGEVSNRVLAFQVDYMAFTRRKLDRLLAYQPKNDVEREALAELIESCGKTLDGTNKATSADAYVEVEVAPGITLPGIKMHHDSETLHLSGILMQKRIIIPGTYPEKKSRPKTIAKRKIEKAIKCNTWRQFKLTVGSYEKIVVQGNTMTDDAVCDLTTEDDDD